MICFGFLFSVSIFWVELAVWEGLGKGDGGECTQDFWPMIFKRGDGNCIFCMH